MLLSHTRPAIAAAALLFALLPSSSHQALAVPLITEFVADNETTLADEDGDFSDWLEIHNPDAAAVDLTGWYLTDSATNLTKWPIPAITLQPGEFIVVFASGKDRRVPGSELHTNFGLGAGGEYLGLVMADGTTVAHDYSPEYPNQDPDRSFGIAFDGVPLVNEGATAQILVPSNGTLGTTWTQTGFTPSGWTSGDTGIGFGLQIPGMTVRDVHSSVALNSLATADSALAGNNVVSEDIEVHQVCNFFDTGGDGHFGSNSVFPGGGGDDYTVEVTGTIIIPTSGNWTFGLNSDDGGRIRINGANVMVDDTLHGPQDHFGTVNLSAGAHTIEAMFFERGGGAEMELFAAPGSFTTFNAGFQLVGDTGNGGLAVFTSPDGSSGGGGVIATDLGPQMEGINSGAYVRLPFTVNDVNALDSLSLSMRYNDGFVAYLNGTRVTSSNAPAGTPAWNATATADLDPSDAFVPVPFNLTSHIGLLNNGSNNVLAIHGLNISAANDSFLVLPELLGGGLLAGDPFFFDSPTPGTINSAPSSQGKVADTKFFPDRGFYSNGFQVSITTATEDATIRYTTDGSKPTDSHGTVYSGPITINGTSTLRAAAFKTGFDPTDVDTHTYIFVDDVITQSTSAPPGWPTGPVNGQVYDYGMDQAVVNNANPEIGGVQHTKDALMAIPTLSIVTDQANLTSAGTGIYSNAGNRGFAWERESSIELIFPPGFVDPYGNDEGFQSPMGLRIRGGFSRRAQNPKHSFRLFFRSEYGNGRLNYKLFGDEGADNFDKFDLRGPQNYSWAMGGSGQNSFIRDTWSRDLQGEMGHPYTRGRWHHLYLNGVYWGMCQTDERAEAAYGETYFGGEQLDYDVVKSFGDVTDGNRSSYERLWNKWQAGFTTNAALFDIQGKNASGNPDPAHEKLVDLPNLIDYMIITYYTADRDGPGSRFTQPRPNNYFGVYNRNNPDGYKFFEHDSEHSMGTHGNAFNMVTPFTSSSTLNDFNPHTLHEKLATDNLEYRMEFADRIAMYCYNGGLLTPEQGNARVDRRADVIDGAIIAHSARWGDTTRSRTNWQGAVQNVRNFIDGRVPIMIGQLRAVNWYPSMDPPVYSQHGGTISSTQQLLISGNPGTIYYTLNDDDPRMQGGAIDPNAEMFQSSTLSQTLVSTGSTWKYLDDGSNQGTAWRAPGFNDTSWASGAAQLGYGDGDEATEVESGPDNSKFVTTYYRHTFNATGVASYTSLSLELQRDDGAVVYLNGNEIARSNMPNGTITHLTNAAGVAGGDDETTLFGFDIAPGALTEGSNTLAVEIHQVSGTSSDTSFDLRLVGVQTTTADPLFLTTPGVNVLRSRVLDGIEWSAITEATFLVDTDLATPVNLAITEIHYRPSSPSTAEITAGFNERSDFEFIELENVSDRHVDLGGLAFTTGIGFAFDDSLLGRVLAPGERILLVNNLAAFEMRYGGGLPVAGEFSGSLSNDGEQLIITDAASAIVLDVTYNDADPWPASADGDGYSLVLIDPASNPDPNVPTSYRTSAAANGNPGTTDAMSYGAWKLANGITDDNGDPEGDDLTHFMEYSLGGDPFQPSPTSAPRAEFRTFTVDSIAGTYLAIDLPRRLGADDIEAKAEVSLDLTDWMNGEPHLVLESAINNNDGTETLTYRSANPMTAEPRLFVRGEFTLKP